jgi:hypothetical protein
MTADQWKALPLTERVGLMPKAKFYDGDTELNARDAIAALKAS